MLPLLEEAGKSRDYFISNEIVYMAEPRDRKHIRPYEGYIKDYIERGLWFESVAHGTIDHKQKLARLIEAGPHRLPVFREAERDLPHNWRDNPVLVFVHQFIKDTEEFCFRPIRSVVRLKALNDIPSIWGKEFDIALKQANARAVGLIRPIQAKRELDSPLVAAVESDTPFFASLDSETPRDVVKRRTQIAKDITDNLTPSKADRRVYGQRIDIWPLET